MDIYVCPYTHLPIYLRSSKATVPDHVIKTIEHMNKTVQIQIWDTAGQDRFREPALSYYRGAVGVVLVYDVTEEKSFESLKYWIDRISANGESDAEIILVGNKIDMINQINVKQESAAELAKNHEIAYFQTSAKDSTNIDMAMKHLLTNIMNKEVLQEKIEFSANIRLGSTRPNNRQNSKCC